MPRSKAGHDDDVTAPATAQYPLPWSTAVMSQPSIDRGANNSGGLRDCTNTTEPIVSAMACRVNWHCGRRPATTERDAKQVEQRNADRR